MAGLCPHGRTAPPKVPPRKPRSGFYLFDINDLLMGFPLPQPVFRHSRWANGNEVLDLLPERRHGDPKSSQRAACVARLPVAVILSGLLAGLMAGCSGLAAVTEVPTTGPDPALNKVVATYLNGLFKDRSAYDAFEISEYRWVHTTKGWNWLTCVRYHDHGNTRVYAVFVKETVVDARYAVLTDDCSSPAYAPFDLMTGASGVSAPGALAPLH
jgi:hypothetical protein